MTNSTHAPARRPQNADGGLCNDPTFQWANNLRTNVPGKRYSGFLIPIKQEKRENGLELDEFLSSLGWEQVTIKHTDSTKTYWALPTLDAFVIAEGVQSWNEIRNDTDPASSAFVRYGIAAAWNNDKFTSMLRFRCLPTAFLAAGWTHPLMLSVNSYFVQDVLKALYRHFDLLDAIDAARKQQGKEPLNPPFYEVAVELVPGDPVMRGKAGKQSEVVPIVSGVPENFDLNYVRAHYVKDGWKDVIGDLVEKTKLWSQHESKRMAEWKDEQSQPAAQSSNVRPVAANGYGNRNVPQSVNAGHPAEDLPF